MMGAQTVQGQPENAPPRIRVDLLFGPPRTLAPHEAAA